MMNCKKIQELLPVDYIDGEVDQQLKDEIEKHLCACAVCREYEQVLRAKVVEPFKQVKPIQPPDALWSRIQESIAAEQRQPQDIFAGLRDFFGGIMTARRPVFAMATVMTVILMAVVFSRMPGYRRQQVAGDYLNEQLEFISYLDDDAANGTNGDALSFGTAIEEYLL